MRDIHGIDELSRGAMNRRLSDGIEVAR